VKLAHLDRRATGDDGLAPPLHALTAEQRAALASLLKTADPLPK